MEIRPAKEYKKPLYALGVATAIMALSLTGCADFLSGRRKPDVVNYGSETTVVISKEPLDHEKLAAGIADADYVLKGIAEEN